MRRRNIIRFLAAVFLTAVFFALDGGSDLTGILRLGPIEGQDVMYFTYMAFHYGLYHYMFLVFAVVPHGLDFCEEWCSGIFLMTLKRRGKREYGSRMVLNGALAGGSAAALGFLMYAGTLRLLVPFYDPTGGNAPVFVTLPFGSLLEGGQAWLYFLIRAYFIFLMATLFTGFAVYLSFHMPNPYVTLFSAFFCYRLLKEVGRMIRLPEALQIPWLLAGETLVRSEGITLAAATAVTAGFLFGLIGLSRKTLQGRCENGDV